MTDTLYLIVEALYILKVFSDGVLYTIPWPWHYENILRILICAVIFLRLTQIGIHSKRVWPMVVLSCIMYKLSWAAAGYAFMLDIALLIVGAFGISYRKILKTGFMTGLFVLLFAMLGSLTGCIPDLVYPEYTHGIWRLRHSFGIVYPTDLSAHITFLVLTGWVLYGDKFTVLPVIFTLGSAAFTYYFCKAKCSTAVLCLLAVVIFYCFLLEKLGRRSRALPAAAKHMDKIMAYILPFCALIMISLTLFYNVGGDFMGQLDAMLTHRLLLGWDAIANYGIHPFGSTFALIGSGGTTAQSGSLKYNFIDSSYVLILVRYGYMILLALLAQNIYMGGKLLKNGQRRLIFAAALVAFHSMIEHHLPEIAYNLFLLLPFADFTEKSDNNSQVRKDSKTNFPLQRKRRHIIYAIAVTGGFLIVMVFSRLITWLKTIADIHHIEASGQHRLLIWISCGLLIGTLFLWLCSRIAHGLARNIPIPKKIYAGMGMVVFICLSVFVIGEHSIRQGQSKFQYLLEADRPTIEALLAEDSMAGELYVSHLPEIYIREFDNIPAMALSEESLACHSNTTLITEDSDELHAFLLTGYEYGVLPSGHGIYTNSKTAQEILEQSGTVLTNYYSRQKTANLADLADRNALPVSSNGTLLLNGPEYSLRHGPNVTIYAGTLRVTYKLRLLNHTAKHDTVAIAIISSDWGQAVWNQQDIYWDNFDEDGQYVFIIDTALTNDCPNMDFQLIAMDGVSIEIQSIEYGKQMPTSDGQGGQN